MQRSFGRPGAFITDSRAVTACCYEWAGGEGEGYEIGCWRTKDEVKNELNVSPTISICFYHSISLISDEYLCTGAPRVNEIHGTRYMPRITEPAVTSSGNRVVFPRKRLLLRSPHPPRKIYFEHGGKRRWCRWSGCLRGNREIRAGKTFEYKSSIGVRICSIYVHT